MDFNSLDNKLLEKKSYNYFLPDNLIAQYPLEPRDSSKLLVMDKKTGEISHHNFFEVIKYLNPGDCLVLNNSKVIPARIYAEKSETGAKVEFLLLSQLKNNVWKTLCKPGKKARIGDNFSFGDGDMNAKILDITETGERIIEFESTENFYEKLDKLGTAPLPPYIKTHLEDKSRYQTVYALKNGSSAAPTAGLHFTDDLLFKIKDKGINLAFVTLHVGLGTFRPVKTDNILNHKMHSEFFSISSETCEIINKTKNSGKKVIAVGTTTCRALESAAKKSGLLEKFEGETDIFIFPGYDFKVVDSLITNFHLPESTLIMLVSAFAGYENTMSAYNCAVKHKYRFFSFGDAMLLL